MSDADWISCERAIRIVLERVRALGTETLPLDEAGGRALADELLSPVDHPPWDNSAMDGFAVHADDVRGASDETPVRLPISDDVPAGAFPSGPLERGTAVKVMTGAPVPDGATGVIRVEHTDQDARDGQETAGSGDSGRDGPTVAFRRASDADRNIRLRGEDIRRGDRLLEPGTDLTPAAAALLALAGMARVRVGRRPRIGVLANGDELAGFEDYEEVKAGRRIMNSNGPALRAQVREAGGEPVDLGIARDDPESLRRRFERGASCDGIVSAAGVSVGEHDHVKRVLDDMGFERDFWRVRQRPGSATVFGLLDGRPFWGVPGNPVSAMVTFETLVRPAVRRMAGFARTRRRPIPCRLSESVRGPEDVLSLLRVVVTPSSGNDRPLSGPAAPASGAGDGRGEPVVSLSGPQGSGVLRSMHADGLLILPEGVSEIHAGDLADVLPLREWLIRDE